MHITRVPAIAPVLQADDGLPEKPRVRLPSFKVNGGRGWFPHMVSHKWPRGAAHILYPAKNSHKSWTLVTATSWHLVLDKLYTTMLQKLSKKDLFLRLK
jgi:hypothetical protein